ncbi:MAG: hypothetical protein SPL37_04325 [Prevotella sp.]|nr:hypothetical protein [Prevotella sp.]
MKLNPGRGIKVVLPQHWFKTGLIRRQDAASSASAVGDVHP